MLLLPILMCEAKMLEKGSGEGGEGTAGVFKKGPSGCVPHHFWIEQDFCNLLIFCSKNVYFPTFSWLT